MPRYIDADALVSILNAKADMANTDAKPLFSYVARMVNHLPAADVVEVVRCRDCKHYDDGICQLHSEEPDQYGGGFNMDMLENDFCSYGERKEKNDG